MSEQETPPAVPASEVAPAEENQSSNLNPWKFLPLLYFMQAIPVALVQEMITLVYKDLGVANEPITRWTSLIALPWSLQLLLGPLVDLNYTKRKWILNGQMLIALGLAITPFLLKMPNAFELSLGVLAITAIFSALCNIATDGFILLALRKDEQAKFAGFMSTFFRLGRLTVVGLMVFLAGLLAQVPGITVKSPPGEFFQFKDKSGYVLRREAELIVTQGQITTKDGLSLTPEVKYGNEATALEIKSNGEIFQTVGGKEEKIGQITTASLPAFGDRTEVKQDKAVQVVQAPTTDIGGGTGQSTTSRAGSWFWMLLVLAVVYAIGRMINRTTMPSPALDVDKRDDGNQTRFNIYQTLSIIGLCLGGYFTLNALVRLSAHGIWVMTGRDPNGAYKGWMLANDPKMIGIPVGTSGVMAEVIQLAVCSAIVVGAFGLVRRLVRGTAMGDAYSSYAKQSGFFAILFFMLFYRFGEAMISKISPLFLKDTIANGGLGLPTEQIGIIKGVVGVVGIILGGIAGGFYIKKHGLRRSFLPLALAMHVPNFMYLAAAAIKLPMPTFAGINVTVAFIDFTDQFGYGFGFAGYMIFLMRIAQRGNYRTAHYAIGTGLGALFISVAGVLSGVLQQNFGYTGFFIAVIFCTIPGMLSLLYIPHEDEPQKVAA